MLSTRSEHILKLVVEDYIRTAEPVGSRYLNEQYHLGVSPATVRNEMALLESLGYLRAPHTSSGRVPTELAYIYYLQHLRDRRVVAPDESLSEATNEAHDIDTALRMIARVLVEVSGETAIVAMNPKWAYTTGIGNLFEKPDFQELGHVRGLSQQVNKFEDVVESVYDQVLEEPQVWIGSGNPFGKEMATIIVRYKYGNNRVGVIGLVGPVRMDYTKNLALLEQAKYLIDHYE